MDVNELGKRSEVVRLQDYDEPRRGYLLDVSTGTYQTLGSPPKGAAGYAVELSPEPSAASAGSGPLKILMSTFTDGRTMLLMVGRQTFDLGREDLRLTRTALGRSSRCLSVTHDGREVGTFRYGVGWLQKLGEEDPFHGDLFEYVQSITRTRRDVLRSVYTWEKVRGGESATAPGFFDDLEAFLEQHGESATGAST